MARKKAKRRAGPKNIKRGVPKSVKRRLDVQLKEMDGQRPPLSEQPYDPSEGATQSMLSDWQQCRERAKLYLAGWRAPESKEALEFGSLFHWLLEHAYKMVIAGDIVGWKQAVAAFEGLLAEYMKIYNEKANQWSLGPQTMELLCAQAEGVWPQYCRHWYKDWDLKKTKWLELEGVFDVKWDAPGGQHRLRGMRDGVIRRKDGLWWLETKTKGVWSQDTLERTLGNNFQNLFYILAGELTVAEMGSDETIEGVLYNIVRRPQIKPGKDGDLKAYVERIQADTQERPDFYYNRLELTYPAKRRKQFRADLDAIFSDFKEWWAGKLRHYCDRGSCEGRKWNCQFIDACNKGHLRNYRQDGRLFVELEG